MAQHNTGWLGKGPTWLPSFLPVFSEFWVVAWALGGVRASRPHGAPAMVAHTVTTSAHLSQGAKERDTSKVSNTGKYVGVQFCGSPRVSSAGKQEKLVGQKAEMRPEGLYLGLPARSSNLGGSGLIPSFTCRGKGVRKGKRDSEGNQ